MLRFDWTHQFSITSHKVCILDKPDPFFQGAYRHLKRVGCARLCISRDQYTPVFCPFHKVFNTHLVPTNVSVYWHYSSCYLHYLFFSVQRSISAMVIQLGQRLSYLFRLKSLLLLVSRQHFNIQPSVTSTFFACLVVITVKV